ncbi:MAG: M23 family metallopeptidase [Azonexus sp.]|nr:M23 family metallopeptidase [Azonexus sp.]
MQIIIVSRHLKAARTLTIMPRHLVIGTGLLVTVILLAAFLVSWLSMHFRLPVAEDLVHAIQQEESRQASEHVANNLQLMATRLGELQGRLLQLDNLGSRVSDLAGIKQRKPAAPVSAPGQGGPYLPAPMSSDELQEEIERLAASVDRHTDEFSYMEFKLLEKRVESRVLPTTLPVKDAVLGSGFGYRSDPFAGLRARHDGLDFSAPQGTPIVAAADGVVSSADFHPDFGNVVDIDHGDGLTSRYAHMSMIEVVAGQMLRRGEKVGEVGTTGRSTGPHLHFEVRMLGVPQNPANFLKRGQEFAQVKRR